MARILIDIKDRTKKSFDDLVSKMKKASPSKKVTQKSIVLEALGLKDE